jgi:hypothetical protein
MPIYLSVLRAASHQSFKDKKQCRRRLFPIGKNRTASDPAAALFA